MKLNSKILVVIIFVLFFGGIMFSRMMDWWSTESSRQPNRLNIAQENGEYDPADIRGSYTFGDISALFDIPMEDLIPAFQLPDGSNAALYRVNFQESIFEDTDYEMGTSSIELFVAWYRGLPYDRTEESYLLEPAVEILQAQGNLTEEQQAYLLSHTISMETFLVLQNGASAETAEEHTGVLYEISGDITFQDILDWGVTQEEIEAVLGGEMPDTSTVIREYCSREGLQYDDVKTALQAEIDRLQP